MTVKDLVDKLELTVHAGADHLSREVHGGYAGDLLSDVMANCRAGDLWVTMQTHENTVAVASLRDLAGVCLVGGRSPDEETGQRAQTEGVPIVAAQDRTFELVGRLIQAGVSLRNPEG